HRRQARPTAGGADVDVVRGAVDAVPTVEPHPRTGVAVIVRPAEAGAQGGGEVALLKVGGAQEQLRLLRDGPLVVRGRRIVRAARQVHDPEEVLLFDEGQQLEVRRVAPLVPRQRAAGRYRPIGADVIVHG